MGRMYMPVEVSYEGKKKITSGLIDSGADETVVNEKLAKDLGAVMSGKYQAVCGSGFSVEGEYSIFHIEVLKTGHSITIKAGVSDVPFDTDDINDEGLDVILGIDFIQETRILD